MGDDEHPHHHHRHHHHHHHDHNLRAAYLHVLADALTSVLAILALLGGRYLGWSFLDALMGIVGGVVIARWSYGLCRDAARQLLDMVPSEALATRIRERLASAQPDLRVVDLHLWKIGPQANACILSLASAHPQPVEVYRELLSGEAQLDHLTVEVHALSGD